MEENMSLSRPFIFAVQILHLSIFKTSINNKNNNLEIFDRYFTFHIYTTIFFKKHSWTS